MQIDTSYLTSGNAASAVSSQSGSDGDFAGVLQKSAEKNGKQREVSPEEKARQRLEAARAEHQALLKELHDYLEKSPAEHMREAVMKEMGLTEEKLQAMTPEARRAAEADINRRVRERLLGKKEGDDEAEAIAAAAMANGSGTGTPAAEARVDFGSDIANLRSLIANMQAAANS